ncbi:MAG: signal peptidase I [Gammaproteobacteria bacterium]|nr:signal peptidase I [Gammaproteobacteria bacterium]MCW5583989.1 signal peptidase I [Gammaproteobacteria bacterium]
MNFNFELILFYASVVTGLIVLFDVIFLARKRKLAQEGETEIKLPIIIDYARSFFPILLIVFLLRSFLYEPFRIPSGSLEPTLLMGDFILVNKFDYGIRLPVIHKKIYGHDVPQRGDIMVFRWPPNPSYDFIKRVIGLPGDKISYINKELYVNGQKIPQEFVQNSMALGESGNQWQAVEKQEDLLGVKHHIFVDSTKSSRDFHDIIVPDGMYFVMGDNRDDSADSRYWGFVPDKNIVGKAVMVWLSWNSINKNLRFNRIGKLIH